MRAKHPSALFLAAALTAGCADPAPVGRSAPSATTTPSATAVPAGRDPAQRYAVTATVLEGGGHGPQLCVGGIAQSLPPQCGGPDVAPWDWAKVTGEEEVNGTSWGEYRLAGTYDGRVFHLTEPPGPPEPRPSTPSPLDRPSPCPEPAGGWRVTDPSKTGEAAEGAVHAYANTQPDLAAVWLTWPDGAPTGEGSTEADAVLNLAFTGDLDRHRREAAARWGGPLCVTSLPRPRRVLSALQDAIFAKRDEAMAAGVHLLSGSVNEIENRVEIGVLIADDVTRRWIEEHYGPGITITGALQPL